MIQADWGSANVIYGVSFFLPTIIKQLGYTCVSLFFDGITKRLTSPATAANLLTIPMYAVASILSVTMAFFSDRYQNRGFFVVGLQSATLIGFVITSALRI